MCDEHSPFYSHTTPVARLVHRCDECGFPIMPGERHHAVRGKWDGDMRTYRAHVLCDLLAQQVSVDDGCRIYGELREAVGAGCPTPLQARWASAMLGRRVPSAQEVFDGYDEDEA